MELLFEKDNNSIFLSKINMEGIKIMEKYNNKNESFKKEYYDEKNGFWYKKVGDYYFPEYYVGKNLSIDEAIKLKEEKIKNGTESILEFNNNKKKVNLGKYGLMRLEYLKEHKRGLWSELIMTGKLNEHLSEVDKMAKERVDEITKSMAKNDNIPIHYDGKMDQLEWVGLMNNYKHCAEEIILNEIIWQ